MMTITSIAHPNLALAPRLAGRLQWLHARQAMMLRDARVDLRDLLLALRQREVCVGAAVGQGRNLELLVPEVSHGASAP